MITQIQMAATQIVIRVKASPALEPNGLTPPNAPARPPPLPRWMSTSPIRNSPIRMTNRFRRLAAIAIGVQLPDRENRRIFSAPCRTAVNSQYTDSKDAEQGGSRRQTVYH